MATARERSRSPPLRLTRAVQSFKESPTSALFSRVADMRSRGEAVNGALCVGQPDFPPPPEVIAATGEAAQKGLTAYTAIAGTLELRQAICDDLETRKRTKYAPSEIMVACGGKQAIYEVTLALCEAGDEVLVPTPYYTSYPDIVKMSGATPVFVDTTPERCYALEPSAIQAAITERTRMLIVCNPSNPTGGAMDRSQLEAIAALLRKPEYQHIYVLSDEIYERICFDGLEHVSFAALEGMRRRTLTINGFSKSHAMTGYRLGYLAAPASIVKAATKIQSQITSCASSIAQHAGIAALKSAPEPLAAHVVALRRKRDVALKLLEAIPGVTCPTPQGAFYLLPDVSHYFGKKTPSGVAIVDAYSLGLHLLEDYRVALVPGEAFGAPRCLRISYAATEENITDALTKLAECLRRLS